MPSNQREMNREEYRKRRYATSRKIIWIVIAIILAILFLMKIFEINLTEVKNNISGESDSSISSGMGDGFPFKLDSSENVRLFSVDGKVNVMTSNSYNVLNPSTGASIYSYVHGYSHPMINSNGNYSCAFDQGSVSIRLDSNTKNIFETKMSSSILTASCSKNGYVLCATIGKEKKSDVYVLNNKGTTIMRFGISNGYVVSTAMNASGKDCCVAVIDSSNAKIKTDLYTFKKGANKIISKITLEGSAVQGMFYKSSDLYVVADNGVYVIQNQKKSKKVFDSNVNTMYYTKTSSDELIYSYTDFEDSGKYYLSYIKISGKIHSTAELKTSIIGISSYSNEMSALTDGKIYTYKISNGKLKDEKNCSSSAKSELKLASSYYVQEKQNVNKYE